MIQQRTDAVGRTSYRAKVKVKDIDTDRWTAVYGAWTRQQERARREERRLLGRRDAGSLAPTRGQTLAGYLTREWLPAVSRVSKRGRPLAPTTRARYEQAVRRISASIGDVRLVDLRAAHVERLRDELLPETDGELAPQTVADILRVLSQALGKAEARGLIGRNPADAAIVNRPVGKTRDFTVVTPELGKRILAAARNADPWDAATALALGLSLRREEVLGLGWEHVDFDAGVLRVRRTLTYTPGAMHWGPPKSEAGERDLPLPGFVADALRRHHASQARRRLRLGKAWPYEGDIDDLVIDRGDGAPWLPPTFSTYWSRWAEAQGFGSVSFHTLRHGCATLLLAAGVPDRVVIEVMGHSDLKILRRYQDVVPELMRDATDRLGVLLGD
jgi:integrase